MKKIISILYAIISLFPLFVNAQIKDSISNKIGLKKTTFITGIVINESNGQAIAYATIEITGKNIKTKTDHKGQFSITYDGLASSIKISSVGYNSITKEIQVGTTQKLTIILEGTNNQLKDVSVKGARRSRYKNKDNPAVSIIEEIINHKEQNRPLSADYTEFNQYERISFSLFDLSEKFINSKFFRKYQFLLNKKTTINDSAKLALPVYISEKYAEVYSRKNPEKVITIIKVHKEKNLSNFIDTAAVDLYLNRLYGSPNIYENNIFILTKQFLSPISDNAPNFYKYFITDTVLIKGQKLIEVSFTPRNLGDLLFEGKLYVTTDGNFAVMADHLQLNKHININFVRRMDILQDFERSNDGRYLLIKTDIQSDFGLMKDKGLKVFGNRTITYSNYKNGIVKENQFYDGSTQQTDLVAKNKENGLFKILRGDSLSAVNTKIYNNIDSLQQMPSFKRSIWLTKFVTGGYAEFKTVELGPNGSFYSFNDLEGSRISIGGRTTPVFNPNVYLEGYVAYGLKDKRYKYYLATNISFNKLPPWGYPNNYLKLSYQNDTDIPGQNFLITKFQSILGSFTRLKSDLWQYNKIFRVNYFKDFKNHTSFNFGLKYWDQTPADQLLFQTTSNNLINKLKTFEIGLGFRYAPHEQLFLGTRSRHTIHNKYPIFTVNANYAAKGLLDNNFNYVNLSATVYKRFYFSQLGSSDVTLLGGKIFGQVPFPLLSIIPANQTYLFDPNAYNSMNFLEFVSDQYIGIDISHSFEGFLLNKVPLIKKLKLREFLSLKVLYGGLSAQNTPSLQNNLYKFPTNTDGFARTFALGKTPYIELGAGVGNIFKVIRVDVIKRFSYLDHAGVSPLGLRFTIGLDL